MTNAKDLKEDGVRTPRTSKKAFPTKVVCRRLPPTLEKDGFLDLVSPLPEYNYFRFEKPNPEDGNVSFCRAYFNFIHQEDVFNFTERFDGYVFLDKQGNEYPAIVEFSPYQKIPKNSEDQRQDSKSNTMDTDKEYLAFLEVYENKENENAAHPTPEQYLEEIENREKTKETSTPLLEFLAQRKGTKKGKFRERKTRRQRMVESGGHKQDKGSWSKDLGEGDEPNSERKKKSRNEDDRRSRRDKKDSSSKEDRKGYNASEDSGEKGRRVREENAKKDESGESTRRREDKKEGLEGKEDSHPPKRFSDRRRGERSRKQQKDSGEHFQQITLLKKDDFPAIGSSPKEAVETETSSTPSKGKAKKSGGDRIKNKERPAIQIYRPGMGKFSSQTIKGGGESLKEEDSGQRSEEQQQEPPAKGRGTKIYYRSSARRSERTTTESGD